MTAGLVRELAIAEPPVAAVAVHGAGAGPRAEFYRAEALHWLITAMGVPALLRSRGAEEHVTAQTEAILGWLTAITPNTLAQLLTEPGLRVWLADVRAAAVASTTDTESLACVLPLLLIEQLAVIDDRRRWQVHIPADRRFAPLEWPARIRSSTGKPFVTSVETRQGAFPRFSRTDFRLEDRARIGDIEMLEPDSFPELAAAKCPDERPCTLDTPTMQAVLGAGFDYLAQHWSDAIADVAPRCRAVLPIVAPGTHIYSASAAELPLIIKLTLRTDESPALLAETLVHETAHCKLESLWDMAPLLEPGEDPPVHHHPWRPDPRPLRGVFLAVHAFANVMLLYRGAAEADSAGAAHDLAVLESQVAEGLATLEKHAAFTPTGAAVFDRLRQSL
jgi:HEXXH motif-containing protein